jgi:ferredoxin-NADP reductase
VAAIERESEDVLSLTMQRADGQPLQAAMAGQYVVLRLHASVGEPPLFRSYSLSGPLSTERYRISVKVEPNGVAGTYLCEHVAVGDALEVSSPRGSFVLQRGEGPVVLLSAGIGATPVLAMLYALAAAPSSRQVLWLHAARDRQHHPFAADVRRLMRTLAHGRSYVCYSRPGQSDKAGEDFDAAGHLSRAVFEHLGISQEADYLCGPNRFMSDMKEMLASLGVARERIHVEIFNGSESRTPGVIGGATQAPHLPAADADTGPRVSFARSGVTAHWNASAYQSILELAGLATSTRYSCRSGVCQLRDRPGFGRDRVRTGAPRHARRRQPSHLLLAPGSRPCHRFVKLQRDSNSGMVEARSQPKHHSNVAVARPMRSAPPPARRRHAASTRT